MNEVRIREDLELQPLYSIENPPGPQPRELPSVKFEREQAKMDKDKRLWHTRMVWGQHTVGR